MIGADIILFSEQGFGARVILVAVWGLVEAPPPPPTFV